MVSIREVKKGNFILHEGELCEVKDISIEGSKALVELSAVFSKGKYSVNLEADAPIKDADIIRKCGHVISKKETSIEIMDSNNFKTFDAFIDDSLFDDVSEEDKVTYIQFNNNTKILEVRK